MGNSGPGQTCLFRYLLYIQSLGRAGAAIRQGFIQMLDDSKPCTVTQGNKERNTVGKGLRQLDFLA